VALAAVTAILQTQGLTRRFGGLVAVDSVDVTLQPGEIHALIGPNGAGKTTFVSMLVGRLAPTSGRVIFMGRDVTALPAHRRARAGMAYTFQITSVFQRLPVAENVGLAARRRPGLSAGAERVLVGDLLARVGLGGRGDQPAADLGYGHQRLLEIAMGLAQDPRLLILDEPTQGLSDAEIDAFGRLVRSLVPATTILLIEHNMRVVMDLASRITVLNFGRVLATGAPGDIRADPAVQAAYLGAPAAGAS
jgi:branched-chain amino acid transport system ATP-binding protein